MTPGYFGDAGGPFQSFCNELDQKMAAQSLQGTGQIHSNTIRSAAHPSDRAPVETSAQHLFERLGQLQAEVDLLTDRLGLVLRPEMTAGEGCTSSRPPSECQMLEILDQAAERVGQAIGRLGSARNRLCI